MKTKPKEIKSFPSESVDRYLKFYGHLPCERKKMKTQNEKLFDNFCLAVTVVALAYLFVHIIFWKLI